MDLLRERGTAPTTHGTHDTDITTLNREGAGEEVMPRCVGVAFTDSVHWVSGRDPVPVRQFIKKNAVNWVRAPHWVAAGLDGHSPFLYFLLLLLLLFFFSHFGRGQVKSNKPLDAPERGSGEDGCPCVSAGTMASCLPPSHESVLVHVSSHTSYVCVGVSPGRSPQARMDQRLLRGVGVQGTRPLYLPSPTIVAA